MRRAVDEVVADLLAPVLRLERPSRTGWRLVSWDAEQGISLTLVRGDTHVLVELEPRDEALDCYARTARFNVCVRNPFDRARPLGAAARLAMDQLVRLLQERESRLPVVERPAVSRRVAVREIEVDRVLIPEGFGHYYINPYVGCIIGCEFCYVGPRADMSRALEGLPALPWGRYVDVKMNAGELVRREAQTAPPGLVRLSPILTDPYQPLERKYRVTRACLEALVGRGFSPVVLTRGACVVDDLDLLRQFPSAAVGFSVPSDDDRVRRAFEPGADPVEERIEALARCHAAGLHAFAIVQPVLPMDPQRLVGLLAPHVEAVRIDRMYGGDRVRHLYEAAGMLEAAADDFFPRMERELRAGFAARGIPIDEMDDMRSLVAGRTAAP
ncbi:MAG: radical SAM protein [Deltaproteobacteria bacterium]|nr:radical SAM protein [Deltaproteobacteria bacterium]